jgi:hypothetical protein
MEGRRVSEGGDMMGKIPTGEGIMILGAEAFWRREWISVWIFFWCGEFDVWSFG